MIRKIIKIDEEACNGCGLCANACHEGAIAMVDGKARLLRDDYCDGLGDCLPACPAGAISFENREAAAYDKEAVQAHMKKRSTELNPDAATDDGPPQENGNAQLQTFCCKSRLSQWPVQIKLMPLQAPYYHRASLLIAADCTAFAYGNFHEELIRDRITIVGCPKLDAVDYSEKLTEIFRQNDIRDVTIVRMEVPCCRGLEYAVQEALKQSGKRIPLQTVVISTDGKILEG